jgi:hypothetical protein
VEDNPVIAQMVDLAWEEAARTASEDKRRLLAKGGIEPHLQAGPAGYCK